MINLLRPSSRVPTVGSVGYDCYADITEPVAIEGLMPVKVPLGFSMALWPGYWAEIRPRSGLTSKGVHCCLGTIDSDYTGELAALMWARWNYVVQPGDRVCQLVFHHDINMDWKLGVVAAGDRATKGFGSSGK